MRLISTVIPLPFVWPHAVIFWAVAVWVFAPEFAIIRRARRSAGPSDAGSVRVIVAGMRAAFAAAVPLAFVRALQFSSVHRVAVFYTGVAILVAGGLLRRHCWRMLGTSFTGDVRASADQQIVTRGAYAVLRHPSYTAGILVHIGIGIALGSWASAVLLAGASFAVYGYRMRVEERALVAALGEPYQRFMSTRKRVIPFVY